MFKYDANTGDTPALNDRVKIIHTNSDMDGLTGIIGGFGDVHDIIALIVMDNEYMGRKVVSMPVVCLTNIIDE